MAKFCPQPKGRPRKLEKADRLRARVSIDDRESEKVKVRSGGRCELRERYLDSIVPYRCTRRAIHVHHMLGGIGVRGRGESAKAIRKQHLCTRCHSDIGAHVLDRIGGAVPVWTDTYRRVR